MKTMRFFIAAALLVASTSLMANPKARSFDPSKALRQTEQMAKHLDLTVQQMSKIQTINQDYSRKDALLFAQRRAIQSLGFLDETAQRTFKVVLSNNKEARKAAIKSILSDEQWSAYEQLSPSLYPRPYRNSSMPVMSALPFLKNS